ncbi:MAG: hypothetical protein KAT62_10585 [Desulfuromonadales bacterium]|nr:hypothetical protein [Desulfuromonadales bacterium]
MLKDLVKVMKSLRVWDSPSLCRQEMNPDALVAKAWADLGYWHFDQNNLNDAKSAFLSSLREKANKRALFYFFASMLSRRGVSLLRTIKQRVAISFMPRFHCARRRGRTGFAAVSMEIISTLTVRSSYVDLFIFSTWCFGVNRSIGV